ncbi:MAG: hypothetical protein EB060_11255, partial [Proteobacteria bacterium]|nr:hypothetical protein [Pseudomonadota bacterium]
RMLFEMNLDTGISYSSWNDDKVPMQIRFRIYSQIESLAPNSVVLKARSSSLAIGIPRSGYSEYSAGGEHPTRRYLFLKSNEKRCR